MQSLNKYAEMARLSQSWHKVATMLFYNLVTTLAQPDTTLYFETVARLLQGGGKAVKRLYHNLATTLYYETVIRLSQGCYNSS